MSQILNKIKTFTSLSENRPAIFFAAAFAPLILIVYSNAAWLFDAAIPFYAFLLLVIKKPKLFPRKEAQHPQKLIGLLIMISSFFVNFALASFFPGTSFYGAASYAVYTLGLFLLFFEASVLREAFTPIFLIVATVSSSFVSALAEPLFQPAIPGIASLIVTIVRLLGIRTEISFDEETSITIFTPRGTVSSAFVWGCVGFTSMVLFSVLLVVVLFEETCSLRTKILWSIGGLLGIFFLNIARVVMIFVTDYFYGYEAGAQVHYFIGYAIFLTWTGIFYYAFSRKQAKAFKTQESKQNHTQAATQSLR